MHSKITKTTEPLEKNCYILKFLTEFSNVYSHLVINMYDVEVTISFLTNLAVLGFPNKPDTIPIRTPGFKICPESNVSFSCSGNVGAPPGYLKWTKISNGSTTIYSDTVDIDTEIPGTCVFNKTSILSIEVKKDDNNAIFRCEVIHELANSEMFQQTIPEIFVYGNL